MRTHLFAAALTLFSITLVTGSLQAQECLNQGGRGAVVPGAPECCPGLVHIGCDVPAEDGSCPAEGEECAGGFVCAACPDGVCGVGENACNCPDDCIGACLSDGEGRPVVPGAPECCPGLVLIGCDVPNEDGSCPVAGEECAGAAICASCPNGLCGLGENACNCPADCGEGACMAAGVAAPVVPGVIDCCEGLVLIGCNAPDEDGACPTLGGECVGASICAACPDSICGPGENACNCPADCAAE